MQPIDLSKDVLWNGHWAKIACCAGAPRDVLRRTVGRGVASKPT